jgi:DNA-binding NarL/FixJ family response regulator
MNGRLLVVDDEPNLLKALSARLRAEGYEVTTARSGHEAILELAARNPDLIISDIRMPGMDGYALVRHLRSVQGMELLPVIFLSAKDQAADRIAGFRAGVDAYLTKPFEPEELLAMVANILERVKRTHAGIARMVHGAPAQPILLDQETLTVAEERIANMVARGKSNKEIASDLGLSIRTIEKHISHILEKTGFSNRVEIARLVLTRGTV